ncbi:MAG: hypothetical protein H0X72_01715 [Acidobacteria bacterium]|nr:hypothetical protein [Acidobacteriota bacterium]
MLTKATLPITGNLKLGSYLSELKKEYPESRAAESSPIPNTTAYLTVSPFSNISHILLVFSSENKLVSYTLVYPSQQWTSIEEPFKQATTSLKLTISKNLWTIWSENEKETITVTCKDFALISTLSPLKNGQTSGAKRFLFSVSDKSVAESFTGKPQSNNQRRQNVPKITVDSNSNVFPQANSEFTVEFPQKPTIKNVQSEMASVEQANYVSDDYSIFRAEYGTATAEQLSAINKATEEQLTQVGMALGKMVGYTGISVTSGKTNLGIYIKLRGYKIIDGVSYLIEHLMYYGKRSIITVVTGAKAIEYPTTKIYNFINSLKKKFE